jgi:hypothetical protein
VAGGGPGQPRDNAVVPAEAPVRSAVRRRLWLCSLGSVLTLALGAAALTVLLASPAPIALAPPDPVSPSTGPTAAPPAGEQNRPPAWDAARLRQPARPATPPTRATAAATAPAPLTTGPPANQGAIENTTQPVQTEVPLYKNCAQARKAGVTPLHVTDPGYSAKLDRDGDGLACEKNGD